jgi:long-chain acyl-CoA synthetase
MRTSTAAAVAAIGEPGAPEGVWTGSVTMADLLPRAAEQFGSHPAVLCKRDDEWQSTTYVEVGEIWSEMARGLIDLGIEQGERVGILAGTRPEWTYVDFAIASVGAVKVTIYPSNSPEECEWVVGNSEAVAVVCENDSQISKILAVRPRLPHLRHIIVMDPGPASGEAITLAALRERGRTRNRDELVARYSAVTPADPYTFIYTSGTTGPPKGCVLTHANYRSVLNMCHRAELTHAGDVHYLFLPLAHAFALLIQLLSFDTGGTIAYWGGDTLQIVTELQETHPTYFPSVPRIFEKIYTMATAAVAQSSPEDQERFHKAVELGLAVRAMLARGESVPAELQAAFDVADERLYRNVRAIFGGNLRQAVSGAAPIAPEILKFFYACGVPVLEGYGMTETATVATYSTPEHFRFGSVGRPLPGCEMRIADDGEVLIKGANIFRGYYKNDDASFGAIIDGWLHTGDLGSLDEDNYLTITGRKKDIIITSGGKNITPANMENDLKQVRWISQAVMHGDRRPYPVVLVTLDEEQIRPWAQARGLSQDIAELAGDEQVRALIQVELDRINDRYASVEQVKRFVILERDFSQEGGELTPTMKVKRNVVNERYAALLDSLYVD